MMKASTGMKGNLQAKKLRQPNIHKVRQVRLPWGRIAWSADPGVAPLFAEEFLQSTLMARHIDGDGKVVHEYDFGSGMVTAVGVLALANDYNLAAPSGAAINTLKLANYHISGTGTGNEAVSDISIGTISTSGGQTAATGVQTIPTITTLAAGTYPKYQTVGTLSYTGTEAVTEWCLLTSPTVTATTGSPFTAGTSTQGTVTGTPLTASSSTVQGQQQTVFHNTGNGTPSWGLVTSNTTGAVNVPAWLSVASAGAGANPANTNTYVIRPVMLDRRKFSAINVGNGDSIQFTYQLSVQDGN